MAENKALRFGTGCWAARSRVEYVESVRRMEEMGYSVVVCPDHFGDQLGPLTALMAAADASSTLRIGTWVLDNDFRHPVVMAKEAATLDVLSDGRLELGVGAGWLGPDYAGSGIQMDRPGIRVSRLMEAVHVIKGLFSDTPVDFSGRYYRLEGLQGTPKPVQRPHPPLFIGGGSERILSFAGREADIVGLAPPTRGGDADWSHLGSASTAQQIEWVRQAAGGRFSSLELNTVVFKVVVTDHPRQAAEQIALSLDVTPEQVLESIHFLVGTVDGICEEILGWRKRFGVSYVVVFDEDRDTFGPVVKRLAAA